MELLFGLIRALLKLCGEDLTSLRLNNGLGVDVRLGGGREEINALWHSAHFSIPWCVIWEKSIRASLCLNTARIMRQGSRGCRLRTGLLFKRKNGCRLTLTTINQSKCRKNWHQGPFHAVTWQMCEASWFVYWSLNFVVAFSVTVTNKL